MGQPPIGKELQKMAKPPNYKQDKKRREDARKKRNQEKQARLAAGKAPAIDADGNDVGQPVSPMDHIEQPK
ncbi:MAG: hypothetical protein R3F58_12070 [Steroidobacteraceae bacterium]